MPHLLLVGAVVLSSLAVAAPAPARSDNDRGAFSNVLVRVLHPGGHRALVPLDVAARLCGTSPVTLMHNMSRGRDYACAIPEARSAAMRFPRLRDDMFHGDD